VGEEPEVVSVPAQPMAVLFVDICGSTRLYSDVGNDRARHLVADCISRLRSVTLEQGGRVVQVMGDGMLCTFPTADAAFWATTAMRDIQKDLELGIHAGFHFGAVIAAGETIYGDAVNVAARVANLAKAGEIIITNDTVNSLSPSLREQTRLLGRVSVKGKPDPILAYAVVTDESDITAYHPRTDQTLVQTAALRLTYQERHVNLDARLLEFVLGRSPSCDLVVEDTYASRRHASIDCRRGKFFVLDHSTNGTYIGRADGEITLLRRETLQLEGTGFLSLGSNPKRDANHLIHFSSLSLNMSMGG
jgi:adenylate cyclase